MVESLIKVIKMYKKEKEKRIRADLATQASRDAELLFEMTQHNELRNLAKSGNTFAKHELKCIESGLSVNLEALMEFPCSHSLELPFGDFLELRCIKITRLANGFVIAERICPICGKTLQKSVRKAKEPRRGC